MAANAPDIDILAAAWGSETYLNYHRHLTHSLLLAPVLALLPLLIIRLVARKQMAWGKPYLISLIGVASHLALDSTNLYGVRLLLPFSARWFRLDINPLTDPWILTALLLAVIAPALSRLVSSEIGDPGRPGRAAGVLALTFFTAWDIGRFVLHERALAMLESRVYAGSPPRRVAAFPVSANPLAWRGLVESASSYTVFQLNVESEFDPTEGRVFYQSDREDAIRIAAQTPAFRDFVAFVQYPLWSVTPMADPEQGLQVELYDLRFGLPPHKGFKASAILDGHMKVVRSWFELL